MRKGTTAPATMLERVEHDGDACRLHIRHKGSVVVVIVDALSKKPRGRRLIFDVS